MIIQNIKLVNFRNHSQYELNFEQTTTLILGENGWGKTSILEAVYLGLQGKSFRAVDAEILKRGEGFYRVEMNYFDGRKIVVGFDGTAKTFLVEEKKNRRLPKKNKYPVVLFLPSDLHLISSSPSRRRDYFDRIFGQMEENFGGFLSRYEKALRQRNELLKNEDVSSGDLFSWNMMLAKYGVEIMRARRKFIDKINRRLTEVYRSIAKNEDEIFLKLETEVDGLDEQGYLMRLEQNFQKDKYLGHTSFGVHRDDFVFYFNGKEAEGSASRGETRSIILALKFVEAEMIFEVLRLKPVVLLDDVFSELDAGRRKCLVENFRDNQVIITSVEKV